MQVGKYQLIRELAIGGMAEVFLARTAGPMGFEKQLVLKRILPHLAKDPSFIQMFLSEATLAARLTHPNIVQIFDFGESDGAWFLAMEYIDGPSLRTLLDDAIERRVPLPAPVCARMIAAACEGLAFAHGFRDPTTGQPLDIVHRDISPDNILLSRQGAVKVVDFGIAKAAGQRHRTKTGLIKGKLPYMPPEQLRAQELDQRVDVYALGVVFYELVTGQRPYDAPTDASLMQSILFEPPMPAVLRQPDLPEPVQKIIRRAMAKDREQRYPDCLAFQADLEQYILSTGKPVTTLHVAQLIAQVSPPMADAPLPPLPPGSPPLEDTTIRKAPEPAQAPAPAQAQAQAPAQAQARAIVDTSRPAPAEAQAAAPLPAQALEPAPAAPPATPSPGSKDPGASHSRGGLLRVALAAAVLLASGGGYLLWRANSGPAQPTPVVAVPPPTTPPEPAPPPDEAVAVAPPAVPEPEPPPVLPTPPSDPQPPEPAAPTESEQMGIIEFQIKPSAIVFLEGKRLGPTPLGPVKIAEGTYTVRLVNRELKKDVKGNVEVKAGQTAYVKVDLLAKGTP